VPSVLFEQTWVLPEFKLIDRKKIVDLLYMSVIHSKRNGSYNQACNCTKTMDM